jgi:hypothetical protein
MPKLKEKSGGMLPYPRRAMDLSSLHHLIYEIEVELFQESRTGVYKTFSTIVISCILFPL